jgi:hypothetical protein
MGEVNFVVVSGCDVTIVLHVVFGLFVDFHIGADVEGFVVFADEGKEGEVGDAGKVAFVVQCQASTVRKLFLFIELEPVFYLQLLPQKNTVGYLRGKCIIAANLIAESERASPQLPAKFRSELVEPRQGIIFGGEFDLGVRFSFTVLVLMCDGGATVLQLDTERLNQKMHTLRAYARGR